MALSCGILLCSNWPQIVVHVRVVYGCFVFSCGTHVPNLGLSCFACLFGLCVPIGFSSVALPAFCTTIVCHFCGPLEHVSALLFPFAVKFSPLCVAYNKTLFVGARFCVVLVVFV